MWLMTALLIADLVLIAIPTERVVCALRGEPL